MTMSARSRSCSKRRTRARSRSIRKIDRAGGEAVAKQFVNGWRMSRGVDTSDKGPQSPQPAARKGLE